MHVGARPKGLADQFLRLGHFEAGTLDGEQGLHDLQQQWKRALHDGFQGGTLCLVFELEFSDDGAEQAQRTQNPLLILLPCLLSNAAHGAARSSVMDTGM